LFEIQYPEYLKALQANMQDIDIRHSGDDLFPSVQFPERWQQMALNQISYANY
jgi:hypothetical protein